jgi:hypothetical protein
MLWRFGISYVDLTYDLYGLHHGFNTMVGVSYSWCDLGFNTYIYYMVCFAMV